MNINRACASKKKELEDSIKSNEFSEFYLKREGGIHLTPPSFVILIKFIIFLDKDSKFLVELPIGAILKDTLRS